MIKYVSFTKIHLLIISVEWLIGYMIEIK